VSLSIQSIPLIPLRDNTMADTPALADPPALTGTPAMADTPTMADTPALAGTPEVAGPPAMADSTPMADNPALVDPPAANILANSSQEPSASGAMAQASTDQSNTTATGTTDPSTMEVEQESNSQWQPVTNGTPPNKTAVQQALEATSLIGIKVSRAGDYAGTAFDDKDLKKLFSAIKNLDPNCVLIGAKKDYSTAKYIGQFKTLPVAEKGPYLDMTNKPIASKDPKTPRMVCIISFYLATSTLTYKSISQSPQVQEWMSLGKCKMSTHSLKESYSRDVCYLMGKAPLYTHRAGVASRMAMFFAQAQPLGGTPIPVQLQPRTLKAGSTTAVVMAVMVGESHATLAKKLLEGQKYQTLEWIPETWKRRADKKKSFEERLKMHNLVTSRSRALKLISVSSLNLDRLRTMCSTSTVKEYINDIETRQDTPATGIVYIQYDEPHRELVLAQVQNWIATIKASDQGVEGFKFPNGPELVVRARSKPGTIIDDATQDPPSRFATRFTQEDIQSNKASQTGSSVRSQRPVPAAVVTTGKSFSDALKGTTGDGSNSEGTNQDSASTITNPTNNRSTKSREELEEENKELRQVLLQLQEQQAELTKALQQKQTSHEQQMEQVLERLRHLEMSASSASNQAPTPQPQQLGVPNPAALQPFQLPQPVCDNASPDKDSWPSLQSPPKHHRQHQQQLQMDDNRMDMSCQTPPTNVQETPRKSNQRGAATKPNALPHVAHHVHARSGDRGRSRSDRTRSNSQSSSRSQGSRHSSGHRDTSDMPRGRSCSRSSRAHSSAPSRSRSRDRVPDDDHSVGTLDSHASSHGSSRRRPARGRRDPRDPVFMANQHTLGSNQSQDQPMFPPGKGSDSVSPSGATGPQTS